MVDPEDYFGIPLTKDQIRILCEGRPLTVRFETGETAVIGYIDLFDMDAIISEDGEQWSGEVRMETRR